MTKTFFMGVDGDPSTINLDISLNIGVASTTRSDENGNPSGNPFDEVPFLGYFYINASAANLANFVGDSFNDVLLGSANNDFIAWEHQLNGLGAPKYLLPSGGAAAVDVFDMGAGDDIINLTYINDHNNATPDIPYSDNVQIFGGSGSDIIWSGAGNDHLFGGNISSAGGSETISGGGGNDEIGGSFNAFNNLSGDSGNDTIFGGGTSDGISGGGDNDTVFAGNGTDFVTGDDGDDTLFGGSGIDDVDGGNGNDTVFGDDGADRLNGGLGFLDSIYGATGNDQIEDNDGARVVYGDAGSDIIQVSYASNWNAGLSTIYGGADTDTITFTGSLNSAVTVRVEADAAAGVQGDDLVTARGSYISDTVFLGGGNDSFGYVAFGNSTGTRIDTVFGGDGNDIIATDIGTDLLNGDNGDDSLSGGAGSDTIYGGANNDSISGGSEADLMYGGTEIDSISYATSGAGITIGLNGVAGVGGDAQGDIAWTDIENLTGSNFADSLFGNAGNNTILGLDGNDTIEGLAGADSLSGGNGVDMLTYVSSGAAVNVTLGGGGTGGDAQGDTVAADFENLTGSGFNDTLTGSSTANLILGNGGIDTIFGVDGNDTLYGGALGDSMFGGIGTDIVVGDDGDDVISGNQDNDTLYGGLGRDTIYGGTGTDTIDAGDGNDLIFGRGDVAPGGSTTGWDGVAGSSGVVVAIGTRVQSLDTVDGGAGIDTLNIDDTINNPGIGSYYSAYSGGVLQLTGIEIIIATGLSDVINLTNGSTAALATAVSIFAGNGDDFVFSGSASDLLVGDSTAGGVDVLYGGAGNDVVWGDLLNDNINGLGDRLFGGNDDDSVFGGGGDDTIYGGSGDDVIDGGTGNDRILDAAGGAVITGGAGADIISVDFTRLGQVGLIDGGLNSAGDGNDVVTTTGFYSSVLSNLGLGNDVFIGSGSASGADIDTVFGQDGNDVLSAWSGNDRLFGGDGSDMAWGGSGSDTIYGGLATDNIYPGGGGNNIMYGGAGEDYYYISRDDGAGNQIYDQVRAGDVTDPRDGTTNYIIVFGEFNINETPAAGEPIPDYLQNGIGVHETDHDINDNGTPFNPGDPTAPYDMVQVARDLAGDPTGHLWTLSILGGQGAGTNVQFDDRDIKGIGLWNNDAKPGGEVIESYMWYDAGQGGHLLAGYYYLAPGTAYP